MAFDIQLLKDHPYATGGVVIVGGLIVFYLLSGSQGSSSTASSASSSPSDDQSAALAYSSQIAQASAAAQVQTNAQQVQLQQTQLEAQVASQQIDASLHTNDVNTAATLAATLAQIQAQTTQNQDSLVAQTTQNRDTLAAQTVQQGNQLTYAQNIQEMQDAVLESQINAGVVENANNNATALAGTDATLTYQQYIASLQAGVASQGLTIAGNLAQSEESDYEQNVQAILPNVGKAYNSGLDANNALALQETILARGNPAVAAAGVSSSTTATTSGNQSGLATLNAIINGVTNLGTNVSKGLFA
jgi:hypothetical protein